MITIFIYTQEERLLHSASRQRTLQINISTHEHTQIKLQSFKQFQVKAPKGLKNGAVYEIDYNAMGIPENVIPILDTFITGKCQSLLESQ